MKKIPIYYCVLSTGSSMFQFAYCFIGAATYALRCGGVNGRVEIGLARPELRGLVRQGHAELWPVVPFFLPFLGKQKRENNYLT